jgi:enamine deaminase RidA (YjgF/YER057c/UK114 family)
MKKFRNPETVHAPLGAYSHQIEVSAPKRWLVLSGQVGMRTDGSLPDDPLEQFKLALDNIYKNLQAAGMGIENLVKLTIYLAGEMDTAQRRGISAGWLGEHRPCSTLVYVVRLATPDIKVEIDAWACE